MGKLKKRGRVWWIRYCRSGKRYEESSHSKKESEARSLLRIREGDIERGVPVAPRVGQVRFAEAAEDVLNDYRINNKRSLDDVQRRIEKHLKPFLANRRLSSIATSDVRAYIVARQACRTIEVKPFQFTARDGSIRKVPAQRRSVPGVSNAEINRELTTLKRMFNLALQAGKLIQKPYIPMLRENNVRTGFFDHNDFEAVLRHVPRDVRPVIAFAYITGWRIDSEVLPLQWKHVDLSTGEVRLDPGTTKNGEGRTFPMTAELRRLLKQQRAAADAVQRKHNRVVSHVFHRAGKPVRSFRVAFRTACRLAGCPGRVPHDFRRTAVRNLVRAGIPERVAMQLTGHKTRSVFERYNIVSPGDLRDAARRLDRLNGTVSGTIESNGAIGTKIAEAQVPA